MSKARSRTSSWGERLRWASAVHVVSACEVACSVALAGAPCGCGYRAVYGESAGPSLHVKLVRTLIADAVASDEVVAGAREELARAGILASGEGFPRMEIEVLRDDYSSRGPAAVRGEPQARATAVAVVARAWVARLPGAPAESDTGDLRAEDTIAIDAEGVSLDLRAQTFHDAYALRAAARRVGHKLALKFVGLPASSEEDFNHM